MRKANNANATNNNNASTSNQQSIISSNSLSNFSSGARSSSSTSSSSSSALASPSTSSSSMTINNVKNSLSTNNCQPPAPPQPQPPPQSSNNSTNGNSSSMSESIQTASPMVVVASETCHLTSTVNSSLSDTSSLLTASASSINQDKINANNAPTTTATINTNKTNLVNNSPPSWNYPHPVISAGSLLNYHHQAASASSTPPPSSVPVTSISSCSTSSLIGQLWNTNSHSQKCPTILPDVTTSSTSLLLSAAAATAAAAASSSSSTSSMILPTATAIRSSVSQSSSLSSLLQQQHHHHQQQQSSSSSLNPYGTGSISSSAMVTLPTDYIDDYGVVLSTTGDMAGGVGHHSTYHHHHSPYSLTAATASQQQQHQQLSSSGQYNQSNRTNTTTTNIYEIPSSSVLLNRLSATNCTAGAGSGGSGASSSCWTTGSTGTTANTANNVYKRSGNNQYNKTQQSSSNEYESLIKRYAELDSFHVEVVTKLSMTEAENRQHRKRYDELLQQLNQSMSARETLQDELNMMASKYNKACRELERVQDQLANVKRQRDEANKECENAMIGRSKANRERQQMYEERNNAIREYNLIMSERDSVHKEIEKLQEDLQDIQKRNDCLEKEYKLTQDEQQSLRRELASALLDRDRALKTCNDLREKLGESHSLTSHHSQNSFNHVYCQLPFQQQDSQQSLPGQSVEANVGNDHTAPNNNCSSSSNGSLIGTGIIVSGQSPTTTTGTTFKANLSLINNKSPANMAGGGVVSANMTTSSSTSSVSTFSAAAAASSSIQCSQQQHSTPLINKTSSMSNDTNTSNNSLAPNLVSHSNNQCHHNETECNLREQNKQLQIDLQKANQEIDTWKNRRDWAINERDKIVLERESVRALCDKLRRERDRKNSDLADALRESYEIKRQKNEALKELEMLKEKFDLAMKANKSNANNNHDDSFEQTNTNDTNENNAKMKNQTTAPITCTSQDSAIDVDDVAANNNNNAHCLANYPEELLHIQLKRDSINVDWGFQLAVAGQSIHLIQSSILVANVSLNSIAHSLGLRAFDQILQMNHLNLTNNQSGRNEHHISTQLINAQSLINDELLLNLKIRRGARINSMLLTQKILHQISLPILNNDNDFNNDDSMMKMFGFSGDLALITTKHSSIDMHHHKNALAIGDRIISINGTSLNKILNRHLLQYMFKSADNHSNIVKIQLLRTNDERTLKQSPPPPQPTTSTNATPANAATIGDNNKSKAELALNCAASFSNNKDNSNVMNDGRHHYKCDPDEPLLDSGQTGDNITHKRDLHLHRHHQQQQQQTDSEIDDEDDEPRATVDEDNDADEDEPNSDKENDDDEEDDLNSDVPKTIAKLDQMLDEYQIEDYYGANCNNAQQPKSAPITQESDYQKLTKNQESNCKEPKSSLLVTNVVRRSSRSFKKSLKQRNTILAAAGCDQFTGAAQEFAMALNPNHGSMAGSGDTWPRYRPNQFLSTMLPLFYKKQNNDSHKNSYSKQQQQSAVTQAASGQPQPSDKRVALSNMENMAMIANHYATTTMNRRKQRKSLDVMKSATTCIMTSANNTPDNNNNTGGGAGIVGQGAPIVCSSSTTIDTSAVSSSASSSCQVPTPVLAPTTSSTGQHCRSARHREHNNSVTVNYEPLYGQTRMNNNAANNAGSVKCYPTRPLSYDHKAALQAAMMINYGQQQPQPQLVMFQQANASNQPVSTSLSAHYHLPYHLDTSTQKTNQLQRNLTYNSSLKNNRVVSYLMGHSESNANNSRPEYYYRSLNDPLQSSVTATTAILNTNYSTNSPMYVTMKDLANNSSSQTQTSGQTSQVANQQTSQSSTSSQTSIYGSHYGSLQTPQQQLVDYSVVSAQTQDKNLLKYYKLRQASTSINHENNAVSVNANNNNLASVPIRPSHHSLSYQSSVSSAPNDIHSGTASASLIGLYDMSYGQSNCPTKNRGADKIYGTIAGSSIRNSLPITGAIGPIVSQSLSSSVNNYYSNNNSNNNHNNMVSKLNSNIAIGGTHHHHSHMTPQQQPSQVNQSQSVNQNRHSMNLSLNASLLPNRDSLILSNTNAANGNNNQQQQQWQNDFTNSLNNKTLQVTSISLPNASSINRSLYKDSFINYPNIYDNSNLSARSSISNTRGNVIAGTLHNYSLSENIYGSSKAGQLFASIQQQPAQPQAPPPPGPPPPPPPTATSETNEQYYTTSGDDGSHHHHQLIMSPPQNTFQDVDSFFSLTRSQRLRIPSNSSSVSGTGGAGGPITNTKTNHKTLSGLFFDKSSFTMTPVAASSTTTPVAIPVISGPSLGSIGDRNSYVSNSGSGPQIEVQWIKCSKDGSPGSPIMDNKAKPDDYRLITINRSSATLGIRIMRTMNDQKGVFVESVIDGSLADQAGIRVGDQIIDICGLNMRTADFENAAKVLNQCSDPIKMLVQKNYDKFKETQNKQYRMSSPITSVATLDRDCVSVNSYDVNSDVINVNDANATSAASRVRMPIVGRDDDVMDNVIGNATSDNR